MDGKGVTCSLKTKLTPVTTYVAGVVLLKQGSLNSLLFSLYCYAYNYFR